MIVVHILILCIYINMTTCLSLKVIVLQYLYKAQSNKILASQRVHNWQATFLIQLENTLNVIVATRIVKYFID